MSIDEILERAEKVEETGAGEEEGHELLSAFKASVPAYGLDDYKIFSFCLSYRWF